jgi:hypothetical protein
MTKMGQLVSFEDYSRKYARARRNRRVGTVLGIAFAASAAVGMGYAIPALKELVPAITSTVNSYMPSNADFGFRP